MTGKLPFSRALLVAAAMLSAGAAADAQRNAGPVAEEAMKAPVPRLVARRAQVFFCSIPDSQCRSNADVFLMEETRDLYVFVAWDMLGGAHVQTVEFYLPDGHLYQRQVQAFHVTSVPLRFAKGVRIPAALAGRLQPEPKENFMTVSRGARTVITPLAVAGSQITQHRLLGRWTVRVQLDGGPVLTARFTLRPKAPDPEGGVR